MVAGGAFLNSPGGGGGPWQRGARAHQPEGKRHQQAPGRPPGIFPEILFGAFVLLSQNRMEEAMFIFGG